MMLFSMTSPGYAASSAYYGPDKPVSEVYQGSDGWAISLKCKDDGSDDDCVVAAVKNGRITKTIFSSSQQPRIKWHGDVAMMSYPCGSGCRNDMFFSPPDKIDGGELIDEDAIDIKRKLVVSVASNPIRIFRLFSGGNKPIATLQLDTNYSEPDIERMRWQIDRLVVWYRDDAGRLRRASVSIPR